MCVGVVSVHQTRAVWPSSVATHASCPAPSARHTRTVRSSEPDMTWPLRTSTQLTSSVWPSSRPSRAHACSRVRSSAPPASARKADCPSADAASA